MMYDIWHRIVHLGVGGVRAWLVCMASDALRGWCGANMQQLHCGWQHCPMLPIRATRRNTELLGIIRKLWGGMCQNWFGRSRGSPICGRACSVLCAARSEQSATWQVTPDGC
jgi:hypothetical protein